MRKNLFYGVFAALTLGLAACSNDDLVSITDQKVEHDQTQYIAVQISAPRDAVTRADGDFENGATNESNINTLDFFFYDVAGNPTATPIQMTATDITTAIAAGNASFGTPDPNTNGSNVTRLFTSVVPAKLTQGQNLPSQVICIVNGSQTALDNIKEEKLSQLIDRKRTTFRTDNNFVMTNSVYYGQNVLTGRADQRLCATPINANSQLFGTEAEALEKVKNGSHGAIVDIYVERLASKVGLTMAASAVQGYELDNAAGGKVTITFEPTYWSMNATDEEVYLTKRYGVENSDKTINYAPDYGEINSALGGGTTPWWNDPTNFRSYWGSSPSYFANNYPDVSDDVDDLEGNKINYTSYYYSYNDIVNEAAKNGIGAQAIEAKDKAFSTSTTETDGTTTCSGYIYTRESTVSKFRINDIENGNPAAAVASAVVVGKYNVPEGTVIEEDGTFYIDRNAGTNGTFYGTTSDALTKLVSRQRIVFTDATGTTPAGGARFVIAHPSKAVRDIAKTKLAGRLVTIQITEATLTGDPIYFYQLNADGTGAYVQVKADTKDEDGNVTEKGNLDEVNAQLLSVGYMDMFGEGLAFYSIPIRHLNWNNAWYTVTNGVGTYNWTAMQSGSLGVVRNHVYNLTINSIKGLGTALRDAAQPIVPAKEEANQYIAARINILAWHIAKSWAVDL